MRAKSQMEKLFRIVVSLFAWKRLIPPFIRELQMRNVVSKDKLPRSFGISRKLPVQKILVKLV